MKKIARNNIIRAIIRFLRKHVKEEPVEKPPEQTLECWYCGAPITFRGTVPDRAVLMCREHNTETGTTEQS